MNIFNLFKKKVNCINCIHFISGKTILCRGEESMWIYIEECALKYKTSERKVCSGYVCKHGVK